MLDILRLFYLDFNFMKFWQPTADYAGGHDLSVARNNTYLV